MLSNLPSFIIFRRKNYKEKVLNLKSIWLFVFNLLKYEIHERVTSFSWRILELSQGFSFKCFVDHVTIHSCI